jgi:hypothetical protein
MLFMSDDDNDTSESLPPQASSSDTSNWEDRPFTAPDGTDQILTRSQDDEHYNTL